MKRIRKGLELAALALVLGACASSRSEEAGPPVPGVPGGEKIYAPTGPGQRLERVVDPEFHMAAARRDYVAGKRNSASRELEKLEAFLRWEADQTTGERRRAIEESRQEIETLARSVARDDLESVAQLDRAFAHARAALVRE
jgi:hypothetical protein